MVNQQIVCREKLATLNPLFSALLYLSAANSCNSIMSLLILCALPKALATRYKPLIENFCFFGIFFKVLFCLPLWWRNVCKCNQSWPKGSENIPIRTTKRSLGDSKSESVWDTDIYHECSNSDLECSLSASFLSQSNILETSIIQFYVIRFLSSIPANAEVGKIQGDRSDPRVCTYMKIRM